MCVCVLSSILSRHYTRALLLYPPLVFCLIHLSKVEHGGGNSLSLSHVSRFIIPAPKRLGKSSLTFTRRRRQVFLKNVYRLFISFRLMCVQTFSLFLIFGPAENSVREKNCQ